MEQRNRAQKTALLNEAIEKGIIKPDDRNDLADALAWMNQDEARAYWRGLKTEQYQQRMQWIAHSVLDCYSARAIWDWTEGNETREQMMADAKSYALREVEEAVQAVACRESAVARREQGYEKDMRDHRELIEGLSRRNDALALEINSERDENGRLRSRVLDLEDEVADLTAALQNATRLAEAVRMLAAIIKEA